MAMPGRPAEGRCACWRTRACCTASPGTAITSQCANAEITPSGRVAAGPGLRDPGPDRRIAGSADRRTAGTPERRARTGGIPERSAIRTLERDPPPERLGTRGAFLAVPEQPPLARLASQQADLACSSLVINRPLTAPSANGTGPRSIVPGGRNAEWTRGRHSGPSFRVLRRSRSFPGTWSSARLDPRRLPSRVASREVLAPTVKPGRDRRWVITG